MEEMGMLLSSVAVYPDILKLPVMRRLRELTDALEGGRGPEGVRCYAALAGALAEAGYSALGDCLHDHLRYDSAPYPEAAAAGQEPEWLARAARRDVELLRRLSEVSCAQWKRALSACLPEAWQETAAGLPEWECRAPFTFESLRAFYRSHGAGVFSRYRAFLWEDGRLRPVEDPDYARPEELFGYELQRRQVEENTRALMAGQRVNNVLLYGESGTGKSAAVKSLLGQPGLEGLRIIEVDKEELGQLHELIRTLGHRPQKFILFIDDLAFDKDDKTYSALKTILEGGLERRPANVAVYATSNRRHLVRETFSDRAGDEVDATETIQEKTSLSERFGLRIPYLALDQKQYLELVEALAAQAGLTLERDALRSQAVRWEMRHPGRTPRTAQQFIASLKV